jgi:hypothetical protein
LPRNALLPKPRFDIEDEETTQTLDWVALSTQPHWRLFWSSEPVSRLITESVRSCTSPTSTWDETQYNRGRLAALYDLQHLPELEAKRRTIQKDGVAVAGEASQSRWRDRLTNAWRALGA